MSDDWIDSKTFWDQRDLSLQKDYVKNQFSILLREGGFTEHRCTTSSLEEFQLSESQWDIQGLKCSITLRDHGQVGLHYIGFHCVHPSPTLLFSQIPEDLEDYLVGRGWRWFCLRPHGPLYLSYRVIRKIYLSSDSVTFSVSPEITLKNPCVEIGSHVW